MTPNGHVPHQLPDTGKDLFSKTIRSCVLGLKSSIVLKHVPAIVTLIIFLQPHELHSSFCREAIRNPDLTVRMRV